VNDGHSLGNGRLSCPATINARLRPVDAFHAALTSLEISPLNQRYMRRGSRSCALVIDSVVRDRIVQYVAYRGMVHLIYASVNLIE